VVGVTGVTTFRGTERSAPLSELSEAALGELRLREPDAVRKLEQSLRRHGQLEPLVTFSEAEGGPLEVLDGFKRLHVARQLRWSELRVRVANVERLQAKVLLLDLHGQRGLSALEEAWLVRSLYRTHTLSQGAIGARLGRHKSWVSRRLLLAEQLDAVVQADVRLGLLSPRAALSLVALPRGNQKAVADVVVRRALTTRQTELLVQDLTSCEPGVMAQRLADWAQGERTQQPVRPRKARSRSEADWISQDITILRNVGARLEARLLSTLPGTLTEGAEQVIDRGLTGLLPVLDALANTARKKLERQRGAA
jgi:ParB-like chromosome segregation protein Spo0J